MLLVRRTSRDEPSQINKPFVGFGVRCYASLRYNLEVARSASATFRQPAAGGLHSACCRERSTPGEPRGADSPSRQRWHP